MPIYQFIYLNSKNFPALYFYDRSLPYILFIFLISHHGYSMILLVEILFIRYKIKMSKLKTNILTLIFIENTVLIYGLKLYFLLNNMVYFQNFYYFNSYITYNTTFL